MVRTVDVRFSEEEESRKIMGTDYKRTRANEARRAQPCKDSPKRFKGWRGGVGRNAVALSELSRLRVA